MSWKRIPPSPLLRLRRGWKTGLKASLTVLTTLGVVVTLAGAWPPVLLVGTGVFSIAVGIRWAWMKGQSSLLPSTLVDELRDDQEYQAAYCTASQLREACEMTKPYYGNEYVPGTVAEQWRTKDPKAFVAITNEDGELCACFGVLALSPSFTHVFYKGQCTDTTLESDDILASEEAKHSPRLYLSGVVVREPHTQKGHKRARVMLWALLNYYQHRFGLKKDRTLFGLAVTPESERLLKTFKFRLASGRSDRHDNHNLYELRMSKSAWEKIFARVLDLSSICNVDWT